MYPILCKGNVNFLFATVPEKPITAALVESVLSRQLDYLEPTLTVMVID
jgi:hypothetical protein